MENDELNVAQEEQQVEQDVQEEQVQEEQAPQDETPMGQEAEEAVHADQDGEISNRDKLEFYKRDLKTILIYCTIGWTIAFIGFIILNINNSLLWILPVTMIPAGIVCIIPVYRKISRGSTIKGVWVDVEIETTYEDGHKERRADFGGSLGATLLYLIPVILKSILCVFMLPFIILHRAFMIFKLSKEFGEQKQSYKWLGFTGAAMVYFIVGLVLWGTGSMSGLGTGRKVKDDFKDKPEEKTAIINAVKDYMYTHKHKADTSYFYVEYDQTTKTYKFKVKEGEEQNFDSSYSKVLEAGHVYTINVDTKAMTVDGADLSTRYSGNTLTEVQRDLTYLCPLLAIPFDEMAANPDKVAIQDYMPNLYDVKYVNGDTEIVFTINGGMQFIKPLYSISSYTLKDSILGYSLRYEYVGEESMFD